MAQLTSKIGCLLLIAPEIPDERRIYRPVPFELDDLRGYFDPERIFDKLHQASVYLYGDDGRLLDVGNESKVNEEKIYFHDFTGKNNGRLMCITDIRRGIVSSAGSSPRHYLALNKDFTTYRWILCETMCLHADSEQNLENLLRDEF